MLHTWMCSPQFAERNFQFEERPPRGQWLSGWRRGDDTRHPCFLTEREARSYMVDPLRRIAVLER